MVEFKERADAIIKERWGIEVEHVTAMKSQRERERERERLTSPCSTMCFQEASTLEPSKDFPSQEELGVSISNTDQKLTYQDIFYRPIQTREDKRIYGFPMRRTPWCMGSLKRDPIGKMLHNMRGGGTTQRIQYLGIAVDEPERLARLDKVTKLSPLEAIGWTEADCRKWCEENNLLSPIYTTATRGGCWFCHNQGVDQLRQLRKNYPDLWKILLKWDEDSPVTFHSNGKTVRDYDKRFMLEDLRQIPVDKTFRWKMLDPPDETTPS